MMLPQSGDTRLTGLNRGATGLVAQRARSRLLPGAAPTPAPAQPGPPPMTPAPATQTPAAPMAGYQSMPNGGAPPPGPGGFTEYTGPMVNAAAPTPTAPPAPTLKGVSVAGIDPSNDLRNSTIAPTDAVDRFSLVNDRLKNYDATALPEYRAKRRGIVSDEAAFGRLGSGHLNTSVGDLERTTENDRNSYFGNLLADAAAGTIGDAANNRNELRTERGYQTGAEQSAYDRSRQGVFDTDTLTNSDFTRNLARTQAGFANDPSALIAQLAQMSGANAAGGAAGVGSSSANQSYIDLLKKIYASMGGGAASVPAAGTVGGVGVP